MAFLKDLSHRIRQRSGEVKAHHGQYLLQRLLVAVQRGNGSAEGECHLSAELCG